MVANICRLIECGLESSEGHCLVPNVPQQSTPPQNLGTFRSSHPVPSPVWLPGRLGVAAAQGRPGSRCGETLISGLDCRFPWLQVGLVYMFNLIVGTGALTMPKAFATAGWLVSLIMLVFLGFMR